MELPDLGKQCGVSSCEQLDFLPIKCEFCDLSFCKDHFRPEYHHCSGKYDKVVVQTDDNISYRLPCQHGGCDGGELTPVICPNCSKNFCLAHRHQVDHDCAEYHPVNNPMAEAATKIQKISDKMAPAKKGQGRKSDKLAAKVQLMKLKQQCSGAGNLPQEERLYLQVLLPKSHHSKSQPVYVSHRWTVGRAVDAIASITKVTNRNNIVGVDKLKLFHASDGSCLGAMDQHLNILLENQLLFNGQTIILEYVPESADKIDNFKDYKL